MRRVADLCGLRSTWRALLLLVGLAVPPSAHAQQSAERSLDAQVVRAVNAAETPLVTVPLRAADWSAYPAFALAPAGAWVGALASGSDYDVAYRLTVSEVLAFGAGAVAKRIARRERPYSALSEVRERMNPLDEVGVNPHHSFPSGHATLSFALATSLSLSYPRAAVVAPSLIWATAVAISRVWLGVHYPSDVLAGALLGAGAGAGVHALRETITPSAWQEESKTVTAPVMSVTVPF